MVILEEPIKVIEGSKRGDKEFLKHSRRNKRLKTKVCSALNHEWKSAGYISDETGRDRRSISSVLSSLAKYNLLKKKKFLVRRKYGCSIYVYKMQNGVNVKDLLNALGLRVIKSELLI